MDNFFDEQKEQSLIKTRIVEKYFWAWAKVMIGNKKKSVAYIDLFAGPGIYEDGSKSTPLKVLEKAINNPDIGNMLKTEFNDANSEYSNSLREAINKIPGIEKLKYQPIVTNYDVTNLVNMNTFKQLHFIPTLFFVYPWGYRELSLELITSLIKNWGCDCIFFFNYNRINPALNNPKVKENMNALFGEARAETLREKLEKLQPGNSEERELTIIEEICTALQANGGKYVLPFRFKHENKNRTSHHLIFVTKEFKGYKIMKEIMAKESSEQNQGVASFEYNPATRKQPLLFEYCRRLDELGEMLLKEFAGQTKTMEDIYLEHSIGRPYIAKNYKDALKDLEKQDKIKVEPPANRRRKGTFADDVKVQFTPKE